MANEICVGCTSNAQLQLQLFSAIHIPHHTDKGVVINFSDNNSNLKVSTIDYSNNNKSSISQDTEQAISYSRSDKATEKDDSNHNYEACSEILVQSCLSLQVKILC